MKPTDYNNLREKLLENKKWPLVYMFKFIVPNTDDKVNMVKSKLPKNGKLSFKHTKSLKHVSITCLASMNSADEIVDITIDISTVDGVMVL